MSVKTLADKHVAYTDLLADDEDPFSTNKVTGHSLNYPIIGTCRPTVVCTDTCYFAVGPSTWSASLKKQHRLMNSTKRDSLGVAERIARSARKKKLTFIRWNGGGDLFNESVECIDHVSEMLPDVPQWIVSRKPELASRVKPRFNVWIHVSVDKSSWSRLDEMREMAPVDLQWFWSYQCDAGETPTDSSIAPVIFRDGYDLAGSELLANDCDLSRHEDITGVCETCRRCFSGEAVERAEACSQTSVS